jgi:hypothetical protein
MQICYMQWQPRNTRETIVALLVIFGIACERASPPPKGHQDTATPIAPSPESTVVAKPEASPWDSSAGPALFIAGPTPQEAFVIAPRFTTPTALDSAQFDPALIRSLRVDLFGSGKKVGSARIAATIGSSRSDSCQTWPTARLEFLPGNTTPPPWSVAFAAGHASELAIDSIEALASVDSAQLAADIARIASALPGDTSAAFRGLPFVVNKAWRVRTPTGPTILTAVIVRNVNQEANPRQERILLVATRDSNASALARFTPQYVERTVGLEETLETTDPIAALLIGADRRPTVIIARDAGKGLSYALIERVDSRWQRRWASAYAGC